MHDKRQVKKSAFRAYSTAMKVEISNCPLWVQCVFWILAPSVNATRVSSESGPEIGWPEREVTQLICACIIRIIIGIQRINVPTGERRATQEDSSLLEWECVGLVSSPLSTEKRGVGNKPYTNYTNCRSVYLQWSLLVCACEPQLVPGK